MSAHTPTPWISKERPASIEIRAEHQDNPLVAETWHHANAEFIVRAVNAHQTLVDALQSALNFLDRAYDNHGNDWANQEAADVADIAEAALELAKVKP